MSERTLPSTSLDAYKLSHELAQAHKEKIIEALKELTISNYEQIAIRTGLDRHAVGRRLSELQSEGKIFRTGTQKPTSSGRNAFCYCITAKATAAPERKKRPSPTQKNALVQQTLNIFG